MARKEVKINNKKGIAVLVGSLFLLFFFVVLVPFWFVNYLSLSGVGHFFEENIIYSLLSLAVFTYFLIVGQYYYNIEIDSYVIKITSYRVILDLFRTKDYIDIPHEMLVSYEFFNRPFSFNKILMLKIKTPAKKKMVKRFNLTMISERDEQKVRFILNTIIAKKNR